MKDFKSGMNIPEQKRLDRPDREKIAKFLIEYDSKSWLTASLKLRECYRRIADEIIALIPDIEEAKREYYNAGLDDATHDAYNAGIEAGEKQERERIVKKLEGSFTCNFEAGEGTVLSISKLGWQALKEGE